MKIEIGLLFVERSRYFKTYYAPSDKGDLRCDKREWKCLKSDVWGGRRNETRLEDSNSVCAPALRPPLLLPLGIIHQQYVHWYYLRWRQREFTLRLFNLNYTFRSILLGVNSIKMALDFIAGCIGGSAGIIAGHPLDTLKVHVQTGRGSALECAKNLFKGGTLAAAYRGVGAPLGGIAVVNAIVFGAYGNTKRALPNPNSLKTHALAGGAAGLLQSFVCAPVELIKTRQQLTTPGEKLPSGAWAGARHIIRTGGFKSLFRGLGVTMARDCPAFAIYFASYEAMTRGDLSVMRVFTAGGVAGTLSWVLLYPIDVVKSRIQSDVIGKYTSAWQCFVQSIRTDGWRCMGKGIWAVTLRAFISNGACFTAVAWTERAWQRALSSDPTVKTFVQAAGLTEAVCHDIPEYVYDM